MRPALMTQTTSLIDSASSWSWVTSTKVMPSSRCRVCSSICMAVRSFLSSAASGSSSSSTDGLVDDGAGQRHALLLAAGHFMDPALGKAAEADHFERLARPAVDLAGRFVGRIWLQPIGDILLDVEMRKQRIVLEDHVDGAPIGRNAVHRRPSISTVPSLGCSKPPIMRRQVVLPQPEGPSSASERALGHREVDVRNGGHGAIVLGDRTEFDIVRRSGCHVCSLRLVGMAVCRCLIATVVKERVSLSFLHGIYPERGILARNAVRGRCISGLRGTARNGGGKR